MLVAFYYLVTGLVALSTMTTNAQVLYGVDHYPFGKASFRAGFPQPQPSIDPGSIFTSDQKARFFYITVTLTLASSTSTSTLYSVTYCTTSTTNLKICTPSGRRRRGLSLSDFGGLYYNEEETSEGETVFLSSPKRYIMRTTKQHYTALLYIKCLLKQGKGYGFRPAK